MKSHSEIIEEFRQELASISATPASNQVIIADGEDHIFNIAKDKKQGRGGYCLNICSDGFAYGNFVNFHTDQKGKWNSATNGQPMSHEEKLELDNRLKRLQEEKMRQEEERQSKVAIQVKEDVINFEKASPEHDYLTKKGILPYNARQNGEKLVIPLMANGKLWNYQTITPDGEKRFVYQGRKKGCYCPILNKQDDFSYILICEGFATGATLRQATDIPVVVAFDAGNLLHVVKDIKATYPESKIIICADNDANKVINGKKPNIGLTKAKQAAVKCGGAIVAYPEFGKKSKLSDFNDLFIESGLDSVRDIILPLMVDRGVDGVNPVSVQTTTDASSPPHSTYASQGDFDLPFRVLGYQGENFYYYSFKKKDIVKLNPSGHTIMNLVQLASLDEWNDSFLNVTASKIPMLAWDKMCQLAYERKIFNEDNRVRGTGVWRDGGRIVVNCGDRVYVDNKVTEFHQLVSESSYVYVAGVKTPHILKQYDRKRFKDFRELLSMPTWEAKSSGVLLAGWVAVAPLCASLEYRSHIFITGQSNSGKSVVSTIIKEALKGLSMNIDGDSSEASIRQTMGYNSKPVVFDEAEGSKGTQEGSIDRVLGLMRLASTGGEVKKFSQNKFESQSPFCLSGVNSPIKKSTDESRISVLTLKRNKDINAKSHFKKLCNLWHDTVDGNFPEQLFSYIIENEATITKNIYTLRDVLRDVLDDPRAAQLIANMLAGWHILGSTKVLDKEQAIQIVKMYNWSQHTAASDDGDPIKLVNYINLSMVKANCGMTLGTRDVTLGELIYCATRDGQLVTRKLAADLLKNYSIKVGKDTVSIGNKNHNFSRLLKDTDWGNKWSRTLGDLEGSVKNKNSYYSDSDTQRSTVIPIRFFLASKLSAGEELDFD